MPRLSALLAYALILAVGAALCWHFFAALPEAARRERAGPCLALEAVEDRRAAPGFALSDRKGRTHKLSDYRGHLVMLNFWATWCPPCVEEAPALEALARAFEGRGLAVLAVSVDDGWEEVDGFVGGGGFGTETPKLTVLLDTPRKVTQGFGTSKFPETYLVDREGRVLYRFINKRDWSGALAQACVASLL